ncbi:MAG: TIGR03085 family protein [Actinobacteria bacterium 69-20]|jgi:uncharacterized protein (TIGR03085 family)|nr:TIGR03085 family protein [Actinomycetota bacterium]OJV26901.1 MAG: TIGR03085 family protein [Actinobacteria bacterium 69-20]
MSDRGAFVARERAALADEFAERGPDEPTLCEGWNTRDLLQHLILRESVTASALLEGRRAYAARIRELDWPEAIDRFRSGPPPGSVFRIPGADAAANAEEFFVHHEDVRRATNGWTKRELPAAIEDTFWRRLRSPFGRIMVRHIGFGLHIQRPDGPHATLRAARPGVVIIGPPSEILLFLFGRQAVADVRLDGPADARERLTHARLGF